MKEKHFKVGDVQRFTHYLQHALKKKKIKHIKNAKDGTFLGIKVIWNKYMPKNRAVLVDENNQVIQIYNL